MIKKLQFFLLLLPAFSLAGTINCKVVGITDGDTIKCLTDKKEQLKIRLYQIDAPERKQAFGTRSKQALSDLVFNKYVIIETHGNDKYRRILGTFYYQGLYSCGITRECIKNYDANLMMIEMGMAWYYPFAKKNPKYKEAQEKAKTNKIGLWSQPHISPWEFRKLKK